MNSCSNKKVNPVVTIAIITAVCLIGDSMLYIVLPTHWKEVGLTSLWEVGVLLAANRLVRLPLNPLVGWLYKKISTRNGIVFAAVLAFLTTLSYGFVEGFIPLLIIRCIWGLAWTFLRLGAYFTIIDFSNDSNRGHYMGTYNGLYRLGSLFGMLIGGIVADYYGLQNTSLLFSIATVVSIPLAFFSIPKSNNNEVEKDTGNSNKKLIWKDASILWVLVTGMLIAMIYQGMFTSTLSHLVEVHNSSTINICGMVIGAASFAGILQALRWSWEPWLAPWIGKKSDGNYGRRPVLIVSLVIASFLFSLISLNISLVPWVLILIGVQITATFLTTIADAIASDVAVKSSSKVVVMTTYSLFIDLGAAIGPIVGYLLSDYWGIYAAYWGAVIILSILSLKYFLPFIWGKIIKSNTL